MSSLGLITRSAVPALTSVLAGAALILLNRWMNGNWSDRFAILPGINLFYLDAPHYLPQPGSVLLLLILSSVGAVLSVWFELMRFEVSGVTCHQGWGFISGFKWFLFSEGTLFFGFFWTYFHFAWSVDYKTGGFPNFHIVTTTSDFARTTIKTTTTIVTTTEQQNSQRDPSPKRKQLWRTRWHLSAL